MNNSIFNPESVNRTRYLSCKCRRPPLLPPSLPSPLPSHAESVVHQTSCSLASVHSVFTPRSRFRRCTCIRIGDTCTRPLHRAHTHTYVQRWWGGKGARWVNRVSAKRWVAISEFLVGKHRHDGPWSRLRAQSCIGDSIGEEGGEKGERRLCRGGFSNGRLVFFESLPIRRPSVFQYVYTHAFPRLAILALLPCTLLWWMRFVSAWISG